MCTAGEKEVSVYSSFPNTTVALRRERTLRMPSQTLVTLFRHRFAMTFNLAASFVRLSPSSERLARNRVEVIHLLPHPLVRGEAEPRRRLPEAAAISGSLLRGLVTRAPQDGARLGQAAFGPSPSGNSTAGRTSRRRAPQAVKQNSGAPADLPRRECSGRLIFVG